MKTHVQTTKQIVASSTTKHQWSELCLTVGTSFFEKKLPTFTFTRLLSENRHGYCTDNNKRCPRDSDGLHASLFLCPLHDHPGQTGPGSKPVVDPCGALPVRGPHLYPLLPHLFLGVSVRGGGSAPGQCMAGQASVRTPHTFWGHSMVSFRCSYGKW